MSGLIKHSWVSDFLLHLICYNVLLCLKDTKKCGLTQTVVPRYLQETGPRDPTAIRQTQGPHADGTRPLQVLLTASRLLMTPNAGWISCSFYTELFG